MATAAQAALNVADEFHAFKAKYGRQYASAAEEGVAMRAFADNLRQIEEHNAKHANGESTWTMGVGPFTDMTFEQFSAAYLMSEPQDCSATNKKLIPLGSSHDLPESVDWRDHDPAILTPVKDQGSCGSCWTFSTTGCLEAHHALKTGDLVSLSEQQLVDCADAFNNNGCNGGLPSQAYEYIMYNGGLDTEDAYPYTAVTGDTCLYKPADVGATVTDVFNVTQGDEPSISVALANRPFASSRQGPVSIAFCVYSGFQNYKSGVYSDPSCPDSSQTVNHAVVAVGYGVSETGEDYFIVRNSWGADWGMEGHFMIQKGVNMCGLAQCASFPIV
eukprot:scaffold1399_cov410-Prasinococcus_capsulatus_cf.AAC.40